MKARGHGGGGRTCLLIDQGGHASRAYLMDHRGRRLAAAEVPLLTACPREGWVEQDPLAMLASVRQAIDQAVAALPAAQPIAAAALATQRSSMVCWDRHTGEPLSAVISWQDRRNAHWLRSLAGQEARVRALTGLPLSPHYGASKMRWCLENLPAVAESAREGRLVMGPLASFLLCGLLPGRPCLVDPANASRTLLWDVSRGDWSGELLEMFAISRWLLPQCVPTRHAFGDLPVGERHVPLHIVTGDQSAAVFCSGGLEPGAAFVNIGTGAFLQVPGSVRAPPPGLLASVVYADQDGLIQMLEGTVNGAGNALEWLAGEQGCSVHELLAGAEGWLENERQPSLFLNGVGGLGSPYWRPDFQSRFVGQGTTAARAVAVLESIAFLLAVNLEVVADVQAVTRVVISGGLSRLDGLGQRMADLCAVPVHRPGFEEATVAGLFHLLNPQAPGLQQEGCRDFAPRPNPGLADRYRRWRAAMHAALG